MNLSLAALPGALPSLPVIMDATVNVVNLLTVAGGATIDRFGLLNVGSTLTTTGLSGLGRVALGGGSLTVNPSGYSEFRGTVSGTGTLRKGGAGDLALYETNTYTGGTTVNAGRLLIANNAALGTGAVTINGGHIRAHLAPRTLSNPLTLNGSFGAGFPNAFPATFDFLTTGGTLSGSFSTVNLVGTLPAGATGYSFTQSPNGSGQRLSLIVVPEANVGLLALLAAPLLVGAFRKRK